MAETTEKKGRGALFWIGWTLTILVSLALIASGALKFSPVTPETEQGLKHIGWEAAKLPTLAILEIVSAVIYLIPQTAVIGAILITGYMGGAIATHFRVSDPINVQIILPILAWLGLWLRDARLRELMPIRK